MCCDRYDVDGLAGSSDLARSQEILHKKVKVLGVAWLDSSFVLFLILFASPRGCFVKITPRPDDTIQ